MAQDQFEKMLGDWETSRENKVKAFDRNDLEHRRIIALIPQLWETIIEPIRNRFDAFNERVGKNYMFSVNSRGEYDFHAIKEGYPRSECTVGINPDFPMLSFSGNIGGKKFYKAYFLKRDDASIYLEEAIEREPIQKRHVPLENLESEALLPFLAAVLASIN
jgi:hypothetical protein